MQVTHQDILTARQLTAEQLVLTPCPQSYLLSEMLGANVYCKLDYLQHTGSFKQRGVANALKHLPGSCKGVIAASAGNHALALSYHGMMQKIPVTVVMPIHAPLIKVETCQRLGANVIQQGDSFALAAKHAQELATQKSLTYVHGFDDPHVIAGQGTMGLEIIDQVADVDAVIIPIGGGGLIAGMAIAIKAVKPEVQVIGVEHARMPLFSESCQAGSPVTMDIEPTLADGLAVGRMGDLSFALAKPLVDRVVQVDEAGLALAILRLMELEKAVVEGAGASSLAAMLSGQLDDLKGKTVVLPLCGGNIDPLVMRRVIQFGMAVDHRLCRLNVTISDRPGGLAMLSSLIAQTHASIHDIQHERIFTGPDINRVLVQLTLEVRNQQHLQDVLNYLQENGLNASIRES